MIIDKNNGRRFGHVNHMQSLKSRDLVVGNRKTKLTTGMGVRLGVLMCVYNHPGIPEACEKSYQTNLLNN
jgi:hypothetical protein